MNMNKGSHTLALISVEEITSEDDKEHLKYLTSEHKCIFLKYLKIDPKFLSAPESFEEFVLLMCMDLNDVGQKRPAVEWIDQLNSWVSFVKDEYENHIQSKKSIQFSIEDKHLIHHLKEERLLTELSSSHISCILDHLEIAGDSPKLWTTISLELEALIGQRKSESYWKKMFDKLTKKLTIKSKILNKLKINNLKIKNKSVLLTNLEERLLEYVNKKNVSNFCVRQQVLHENTCRVCLSYTENMTHIFDESYEGLSLVQKLNLCACITAVHKDDGFPQYICNSCLFLLESAYQFKTLCEKTDLELRNFEHQIIKEETTEHIESDHIFDEEISELEAECDSQPSFNTTSEEYIESSLQVEEIVFEVEEKIKSKPVTNEVVSGMHQCETCGIICKSSSDLKIHKKAHSNFKPHQCNDCGKDFKTRLSLKIHMRSHTGERPYVCETCGKAFKTCSAVNNHRAIHSGVKEFKCPHCSYRACTKANLKIHDRTHSGVQPYICRFCPIKFSTASNMHKHIRNIHQKLKTHKCEQCGRSFFSRESARKHMVTHTGLKPYSCTLCPISYGWYNGLQKHMKMQHPGFKMPTEKSFFNDIQNIFSI